MELRVVKGDEIVHAVPVGAASVHLGRSGANQVVLRDVGVSAHHAVVYREGDAVFVRDLGSTNGTFVNGEVVREPVRLRVGDCLRLGPDLELRVGHSEVAEVRSLRLERVDVPLAWPVTRWPFGLPDLSEFELVGTESVYLARDGLELHEVLVDQPFSAEGVPFVLREQVGGTGPTLRVGGASLPYRLEVDLASSVATLQHVTGEGPRCRIDTANRVALLYALGSRWLDDPPGVGRGWLDDEDLAVAVWGRAHQEHGRNNLNVLVHRIRKAVEEAGLDRWFLERREGQGRVRLDEVVLH